MVLATRDDRRCRAHNRAGEPCGHFAIYGGTVCHVHGGKAPQVKQAAEARLKALVDPAIARLEELIYAEAENVSLAAVKDILDRAGYKPSEKVEAVLLSAFTLRIDRGSDNDDG